MNRALRVLLAGAVACWLAVSARARAGPEAPVVVTADRVALDDGVATGDGHVALTLSGRAVRAQRFRLEVASGVLILEDGSWDRVEGVVHFARARVDLGDATGVLVEARQLAADGAWRVSAGRLTWSADGAHLAAERATLSLCSCEDAPWSLEAREVAVEVDAVATFRAGWVRICGARVLPVPIGAVALADRRTGLLAPEIGWGRDGFVVGAPVMLRLGDSADVVLAPEWRQARGFRAKAEGRYALAPGEGGTVRAAAGADAIEDRWRGQIGVDHGWTPGLGRTALRGDWVSDTGVFTDFGEDLLARTAPWAELQGVAGWGPARVEVDRFTGDGALPQRPVGVALTGWGRRLGPVTWGGGARVDTVGVADGLGPTPDARSRWSGEVGAAGGEWVGPVRVEASAAARGRQWSDADAWASIRAPGRPVLGLWGDVGPLRHVAEVGVAADVGHVTAAHRARLLDERAPRPWGIGPVLRSDWIAAGGLPLSLRVAAPWTPGGLRPSGAARLRRGPWQAGAQGGGSLQRAAVTRDDGVWRAGLGAVRSDDLLWARGELAAQLPGPLSTLRPGYRGQADLLAGQLVSHGPSLGFRSRCDCFALDAAATWSVDRRVPDLGVQVALR